LAVSFWARHTVVGGSVFVLFVDDAAFALSGRALLRKCGHAHRCGVGAGIIAPWVSEVPRTGRRNDAPSCGNPTGPRSLECRLSDRFCEREERVELRGEPIAAVFLPQQRQRHAAAARLGMDMTAPTMPSIKFVEVNGRALGALHGGRPKCKP
jgi:hypothetical protein